MLQRKYLLYETGCTKSCVGLIIAGGQKPFRNGCPCIIHIICVVCGNFCKGIGWGEGKGEGVEAFGNSFLRDLRLKFWIRKLISLLLNMWYIMYWFFSTYLQMHLKSVQKWKQKSKKSESIRNLWNGRNVHLTYVCKRGKKLD